MSNIPKWVFGRNPSEILKLAFENYMSYPILETEINYRWFVYKIKDKDDDFHKAMIERSMIDKFHIVYVKNFNSYSYGTFENAGAVRIKEFFPVYSRRGFVAANKFILILKECGGIECLYGDSGQMRKAIIIEK